MISLDDMTEPELREVFKRVCKAIQDTLPPDTGFIIVAAPAGGKLAQYAGNIPREQSASLMLEVLQRWQDGNYVPREPFAHVPLQTFDTSCPACCSKDTEVWNSSTKHGTGYRCKACDHKFTVPHNR